MTPTEEKKPLEQSIEVGSRESVRTPSKIPLEEGGTPQAAWQEFVSGTTFHGVKFIFESRAAWKKVFWLLLFLAMMWWYGFTCYKHVTKYLSHPTSISVSHKFPGNLLFPAVTICDLDPVRNFDSEGVSLCEELANVTMAMMGNVKTNISAGNMTQNETKVNTTKRTHEQLCQRIVLCLLRDNFLPECQMWTQSPVIRAVLEKAFHYKSDGSNKAKGLEKYLQFCRWDSRDICTPLNFTKSQIDYFTCFTFNSGEKNHSLMTVKQAGILSGMSLVLNVRAFEYSGLDPSEGFRVLIHEQGEHINPAEQGFNVGPGSHAILSLQKQKLTNLPAPYESRCENKKLRDAKRYTLLGCRIECQAKIIEKGCNCTLPQTQESTSLPLCSLLSVCKYKILATFKTDQCDCPLPCDITKFKTQMSYAVFPGEKYIDLRKEVFTAGVKTSFKAYQMVTFNNQFFRDNFLMLQIYYESLNYELIEQNPAYGLENLVADVGGSMGLFLGCSLLSLFEFIDCMCRVMKASMYRVHAVYPKQINVQPIHN